MVKKAVEYPEGEDRKHLISLIANQMKKCFINWNKDSVEDQKILDDLREYSQGAISLSPEDLQLCGQRTYVQRRPQQNNGQRRMQQNNNQRRKILILKNFDIMASFVIEGGHKLHGEIHPQGAKNEVLQILCATLLTSEEVTVNNIPDILDVNNLIQLLREMGSRYRKQELTLILSRPTRLT